MRIARASTSTVAVIAALAASAAFLGAGNADREVAANGRALLLAATSEPPTATVYFPYSNLREMLPNVRHVPRERQDLPGTASSDSVVVGRVVGVEEFRGFVESGNPPTTDNPGARATAYDDPNADWRAVQVQFEVDEVLSGPSAQTMTIYLDALGPATGAQESEAYLEELKRLGRLVLITRTNPSRPEFLGLDRVLADKTFGIATVDGNGALDFPFWSEADDRPSAATFMADVDTLAKLRAQSREPTTRQVR